MPKSSSAPGTFAVWRPESDDVWLNPVKNTSSRAPRNVHVDTFRAKPLKKAGLGFRAAASVRNDTAARRQSLGGETRRRSIPATPASSTKSTPRWTSNIDDDDSDSAN